jgi:hypothetical protein
LHPQLSEPAFCFIQKKRKKKADGWLEENLARSVRPVKPHKLTSEDNRDSNAADQ